jgi:WD40 repeat protein
MLTVEQEHSPLIEIDGGVYIWPVAFSANGEHIVSGGSDGIGVWEVKDGKHTATMEARDVRCLAVSQDGKRIAAGTFNGEVFVWDANTFEQVFSHKDDGFIFTVDFSPDSTRLLVGLNQYTGCSVWDVATRKKVLTLDHEGRVRKAKYSRQGDQIATAADTSVRVWDSSDGRLLVDIPVKVAPDFSTGLLWLNTHIFVVSGSTIKRLEASTGSTVSEWPVPTSDHTSCIALPKHGKFIAYSTDDTVTFWDTSTHAQLGLIQHPQAIFSMALSPDDRLLVIGGFSGKITITSLSCITVSIVPLDYGESEQLSCSARLSK